jgi:small-conductance mechanosensitive channel
MPEREGLMDFSLWETALGSAVREFGERALAYAPNVAAALALLLAGWLVARLVRAVVRRALFSGLGVLRRQPGMGPAVERSQLAPGLVTAAAAVIYWLTFALFIAAAVEQLDLAIAASLLATFASYLPRVVFGLVIVFAAVIFGQLAYTTIGRAAGAAGLPQAPLLGRAAQVTLVFFGVATAADQLGVQSTLLTVVLSVAVASVLGGATLAFGLGSGAEVGNLIAIFYVMKNYRVGQIVRIDGVEGEIVQITQTGVFIAAPEGRVLVPGRKFTEHTSLLVTGGRS